MEGPNKQICLKSGRNLALHPMGHGSKGAKIPSTTIINTASFFKFNHMDFGQIDVDISNLLNEKTKLCKINK